MANRPVDRLYGEQTNMILPILGALLGSMIGVVVWVIVSLITGYEVSYIAMGIGFLAGVGSILAGGRGKLNASICAVIAALAVLSAPFFSAVPFYTEAEIYEVACGVPQE